MHSKHHNQNLEVLAITRSVAEVGVAEDFIWQTNFHICNYVIANMEEEDLKETLVHGGLVSLPIITSICFGSQYKVGKVVL